MHDQLALFILQSATEICFLRTSFHTWRLICKAGLQTLVLAENKHKCYRLKKLWNTSTQRVQRDNLFILSWTCYPFGTELLQNLAKSIFIFETEVRFLFKHRVISLQAWFTFKTIQKLWISFWLLKHFLFMNKPV